MLFSCNRSDQSPAVSERRKATTGFMLDCCTPGRRGFLTGATVKIHGEANKSAEYRAWKAMRTRCNNPNTPGRRWYYDRGIRCCKRWNKYQNFLKDMGRKPTSKHTLDRIHGHLGYCPSNCRWTTYLEQMNNKAKNRMLTFNGETKTYSQWEAKYGIRHNQLYHRMNRGWDAHEALTAPVKTKTVISQEIIQCIRSLAGRTTQREIGIKFGISKNYVGEIIRREKRRAVP